MALELLGLLLDAFGDLLNPALVSWFASNPTLLCLACLLVVYAQPRTCPAAFPSYLAPHCMPHRCNAAWNLVCRLAASDTLSQPCCCPTVLACSRSPPGAQGWPRSSPASSSPLRPASAARARCSCCWVSRVLEQHQHARLNGTQVRCSCMHGLCIAR